MKQPILRMLILIGGFFLLIPAAWLSRRAAPQPVHYETRRDLSIYFTNSDQVIASLRSALVQRSPRVTVTFHGQDDHMADVNLLIKDLMKYVYAETDSPTEGDYLYQQTGGYEMHYSHFPDEDGYRYEVVIVPEYFSTCRQEDAVTEKVQEVLDSLHLKNSATEAEKVRAIYHYVCENTAYDQVHKKNRYYHLKSTAYGALINKTATCQGFAVALYRLLREAGVDARIVQGYVQTGSGREEYHAWNIVCIEGLYYNLDATWDSRNVTETYFLRCDANFTGHERDTDYTDDAFTARYPMAQQDYPLDRKENVT